MRIPVGIAGVGKYLPERVLPNSELETLVDTSDEWIAQRTGIRERRVAAPEETTSEMGAKAGKAALEDAGIDPEEVDLVICATISGDQPFPATANTMGAMLGCEKAGGWDLGAACSGWTFGAQVAAQFIATGAMKTVLVVGVEKLSAFLNYKDRTTCVLFGDGAGATVLTSLERAGRGEYLGERLGMTGHCEDVLSIPAGGTRIPTSAETMTNGQHYIQMGGNKVYRFAVKTLAELVQSSIDRYGRDELGIVIPHQVNQRIIESAADKIELPYDMIYSNIARYGNTSAASVPIALCEAIEDGRMVDGKIACIVAFGAGMSWGSIDLRW